MEQQNRTRKLGRAGSLCILCIAALTGVGCKRSSGAASSSSEAASVAPPPSSAQPSSVAQPTGAPGHLLQEGDRAPNITVRAHNGQELNFSTFRSKPVVVYFYPRDDTPGCTTEAQGFRDSWGEIEKAGALVVGVSTDDNTSHQAFAKKYELPFPLLADTDQKLADAFGVKVWANYAERVTFVIDRSGKVAKVFPKVVPKNHAAEVMAVLHALN